MNFQQERRMNSNHRPGGYGPPALPSAPRRYVSPSLQSVTHARNCGYEQLLRIRFHPMLAANYGKAMKSIQSPTLRDAKHHIMSLIDQVLRVATSVLHPETSKSRRESNS